MSNDPKPPAELAEAALAAKNARPVVAARTDVLLCVCGTTWKPKPGEDLRQLAARLGGGYYPSTTSREGLNYICPECDEEGT